MFAVIRHYHFDPKDGAEIDRWIREDFVPIVKNAKGLCVTIGLIPATARARPPACLRTVGADESVRLAADYIKEHLSKLLIQKPEIIEGPIKAHD